MKLFGKYGILISIVHSAGELVEARMLQFPVCTAVTAVRLDSVQSDLQACPTVCEWGLTGSIAQISGTDNLGTNTFAKKVSAVVKYDKRNNCHRSFLSEVTMKRIKSACICQTLYFMLKEDVEQSYAAQLVKKEVEKYKQSLERNRTQYKIEEETIQSDGSVIIKIIKQYNTSPVGSYLD